MTARGDWMPARRLIPVPLVLALVAALMVSVPPAAADDTPLVDVPPANLTVDGTATQSSDLSPTATAERAIDGATNGDIAFDSVAVTGADPNAWWEVDLGAVHDVPVVELHGRTDCCQDRFEDFSVFVSDAPFTSTSLADTRAQAGVSEYSVTGNTDVTVNLAVDRTARYVRVQLHGTDQLQLAEVLVGGPTFEIDPEVVPSWGVRGITTSLNDNIESEIFAIEQIGNVLYVGGKFEEATARRFDPGVDQPFLMALNATTGEFIDWFRPRLNGAVLALKAAPDGSRLYVGGEFYSVNDEPDTGGLVSLDPQTGEVTDGWRSHLNKFYAPAPALVKTIELSGGYVYAGGSFTNATDATGARRVVYNAARFSVADSTLDQSWRPEVRGGTVWGIAVSESWDRVYLGGKFDEVNGATRDAFATVSITDGQLTGPASIERNSTGQTDVYDVLAVGDLVFVAGSEHNTIVFDASDFSIVNWVFTRSAGGDNQDLELVGNRVYNVCHCRGGSTQGGVWDHYRPSDSWRNPSEGVYKGEVEGVYAISATTGAFIDTFPYDQLEDQWSISAGGWAIHGAPDGCLWLGGDFSRASTGDPYVNALARLCLEGGPRDIGLETPSAPPDDTSAPPAPSGVSAEADGRSVTVTVSPPGDTSDVSYYTVRRDGIVVAKSRSASISFHNEPRGAQVYDVVAVDGAGNESSTASTDAIDVGLGAYRTYVDGRFDNWTTGNEYRPFAYEDGVVGGINAPRAEALYAPDGATQDDGAGVVILGGKVNSGTVYDMAGAFTTTFTLDEPDQVTLALDHRLYSAAAQGTLSARVAIDGQVTTIASRSSGNSQWATTTVPLGTLSAGTHTVAVGGHLSSKRRSFANWWAKVAIDEVAVVSDAPGVDVVDPPSESVRDELPVVIAASDYGSGPNALTVEIDRAWDGGSSTVAYDEATGRYETVLDVSGAQNGNTSYTVTVTDEDGLSASTTVPVSVDNTPPTYEDVVQASSPATWWRLGDSSGTTASDAAASADGTYVGSPQLGQAGLTAGGDTAVEFDGADDGVDLPDSNLINLGTRREAHSIEAWFSTADTNTRQVVYEQGGASRGAAIYIDQGQLYGGLWNTANDGSGDTPWASGPAFVSTPISAGTTYHVVLTFDRTADEVVLYVNGAAVGSVNGVGFLYAHGSDAGIGQMHDSARFHDGTDNGDGHQFGGRIDEVAVYPDVVSSGEVVAHYDAGVGQ